MAVSVLTAATLYILVIESCHRICGLCHLINIIKDLIQHYRRISCKIVWFDQINMGYIFKYITSKSWRKCAQSWLLFPAYFMKQLRKITFILTEKNTDLDVVQEFKTATGHSLACLLTYNLYFSSHKAFEYPATCLFCRSYYTTIIPFIFQNVIH